MKFTIALTTTALLALSGPALAGAHNQASDKASEQASGALGKVPAGLSREGSPGVGPATTKSGNGKKPES